MSKSRLTEATIAEARERQRRGDTLEAIAADYGVSRRALSLAYERYPAPLPKPIVVEPDDDEDDDPSLDLSSLDFESQRKRLAKIIRDEQNLIAQLIADGEIAEARKSKDLLLRAENTLSRLNRTLPEGARVVTDAELKQAETEGLRLIDTIATARPNLCAHCSKQLALTWGRGQA